MNIATAGFFIGLIITAIFTSIAGYFLKTNKALAAFFTVFPTKILSIFILMFLYTSDIKVELKQYTAYLYKALFILFVIVYGIHQLL